MSETKFAMCGKDTPTVLAEMQVQLLTIRDLALFAPADPKAYLLHTADLIEKAIREYDGQAD